ncbi:Ltp family lipoprotein [Corynebacterium sp. HMSC04H06]|uniref:Ltp family lipoprotein n=1 Tax=Corynebacterium sp. HMSC04H06 TaxID=1581050 RepID=UPI0014396E1D|nr:Ltp family lipoprotein [Corynebacterium sp. HMSC04H06]
MSPDAIYNQLVSDYGEKFTSEEGLVGRRQPELIPGYPRRRAQCLATGSTKKSGRPTSLSKSVGARFSSGAAGN